MTSFLKANRLLVVGGYLSGYTWMSLLLWNPRS